MNSRKEGTLMVNAVLVAIFTCAAGIVQNITGFGASVVVLLIFPKLFGLVAASSLNQSICTFTTIRMAIKYRKYLEPKNVVLPSIAYIVSSMFCVWIVKDIDLRLLSIAFGAFLILLAIYCMFIQKNIKINSTPVTAIICGFIGGICSGFFTNGATAMAVYFLACSDDRNHYMANLQTLLAVTNVLNIGLRIYRGIYTADLIPMTIIGVIFIFLGHFFGTKLADKLKPDTLKKFIYMLVAICGVETIIKQIF